MYMNIFSFGLHFICFFTCVKQYASAICQSLGSQILHFDRSRAL